MIWCFVFLIFILCIYATERDIYDIIRNQPVLEPKNGQEFVVGVYLHKPTVDISILYNTIPMKTEAGMEMTCLVPQQHQNGSLVLSGEKPPPKKESPTLSKEEFFKQHFKKRRTCFVERKEYWSYEVCQGKISQFHGNERNPEFSLGDFDDFVDSDREDHQKLLVDVGKWPLKGTSFGNTVYSNGKDGRQTLVGWFCSTKNMIGKISEPRTHRYYIEVYWTKLCDYDGVQEVPAIGDPSDLSSYLVGLEKECISTVQGWWTYELCYGKHVRQYHEERTRNKKNAQVETKITVDYTLGKAKKPQKLSLQVINGKRNAGFVEERYEGGTKCDITGDPRVVTARYKCMNDVSTLALTPPEEISSCIYTIDVAVPALCQHPAFKTTHEPASEIVCYPKGMNEPVKEDKTDSDSDDSDAPSTTLAATETDMVSLLGNLLGAGDLQRMLDTQGAQIVDTQTLDLEISPEEWDRIVENPSELNDLMDKLLPEMSELQQSEEVPGEDDPDEEDDAYSVADKEEL